MEGLARDPMRVIRLIEPEICVSCRFSDVATVTLASGHRQRMIYCRRGDCDNWDLASSEDALSVDLPRDPS